VASGWKVTLELNATTSVTKLIKFHNKKGGGEMLIIIKFIYREFQKIAQLFNTSLRFRPTPPQAIPIRVVTRRLPHTPKSPRK